jgi:hypothetical protein
MGFSRQEKSAFEAFYKSIRHMDTASKEMLLRDYEWRLKVQACMNRVWRRGTNHDT